MTTSSRVSITLRNLLSTFAQMLTFCILCINAHLSHFYMFPILTNSICKNKSQICNCNFICLHSKNEIFYNFLCYDIPEFIYLPFCALDEHIMEVNNVVVWKAVVKYILSRSAFALKAFFANLHYIIFFILLIKEQSWFILQKDISCCKIVILLCSHAKRERKRQWKKVHACNGRRLLAR